jgi:uncharacterized metal-binding protein YceD (DUF177 family)
LKISIEELRNLPQQRLRVEFNETLAGLEAVKPVVGDLVIAANASGIGLIGRVQTLLKLQCHSCLRSFFQAISVDMDEHFVYEHYLTDEEREAPQKELLTRDFVEVVPLAGAVDISDVVYQAVTLATPIYCSCGSECPGPPSYEAAENGSGARTGEANKKLKEEAPIDPRWKNLKTLFPNEESR